MNKKTFWPDASRAGAILGLVSMSCAAIGILLPSIAFVISLINFVATIYLLFYFTRRRSLLYIKEGFTYVQSMSFIAATAIFAGIIMGAYQIVASNFLFTEHFEQTIDSLISTYANLGTLDNKTLDSVQELSRMYIFSPIPALLSQIFSCLLSFCFYGLFISIGTKRDADIFLSNTDDEE